MIALNEQHLAPKRLGEPLKSVAVVAWRRELVEEDGDLRVRVVFHAWNVDSTAFRFDDVDPGSFGSPLHFTREAGICKAVEEEAGVGGEEKQGVSVAVGVDGECTAVIVRIELQRRAGLDNPMGVFEEGLVEDSRIGPDMPNRCSKQSWSTPASSL